MLSPWWNRGYNVAATTTGQRRPGPDFLPDNAWKTQRSSPAPEKRAKIEQAIAELERQVRARRLEFVQLDATLRMFAPSVTAAKRGATRFARSAHFLTGELTRQCQDSVREAKGKPAAATEIAVTALHAKGLDAGDAELRADPSASTGR